MAKEIVMPKLGNTVESVIIVEWKKNIGDSVAEGDVLCEVETDKATVDVEAEASGTLLARFFEADDEVEVLKPFAIIGEAGEDVSGMIPSGSAPDASDSADDAGSSDSNDSGNDSGSGTGSSNEASSAASSAGAPGMSVSGAAVGGAAGVTSGSAASGISPRARNLAASSGLAGLPAMGSGPGGRIIERDVKMALEGRMPLTPAAKAMGQDPPASGTGIGGRVTSVDVSAFASSGPDSAAAASPTQGFMVDSVFPGPVEVKPVKGVRKLIADRMHSSLLGTAQLTLNSSASAESLLKWRAAYKESPEELGLSKVSINDMVMFAVSRLLPRHPELNALFVNGESQVFKHVHLGFAVDTPRGLMVPVIRFADRLSLSQMSAEIKRLAAACREGTISPDELEGGTFTVTNLGSFGIESFTPVLNAPQVAILGVCTIVNSPVEKLDGTVGIEKRMGLSLTIDHQMVDGAPGSRFLKDLSTMLGRLELAAAL